MGNRCVITTKKDIENDGIGVYLHWNGGRDTIEPLLAYCKARGYRKPEDDPYGYAYLVTTMGNFFQDGLSLGVGKLTELDQDNYDNGVYIIENWEIVGRMYHRGLEQREYDFYDALGSINASQPARMQLSPAEIDAIPLPKFYADKKKGE